MVIIIIIITTVGVIARQAGVGHTVTMGIMETLIITMDFMAILTITITTIIHFIGIEILVMQTEEEDTHLIHIMGEMPIGTL